MLTSREIRNSVATHAWSQWSTLGAGGWADGAESPAQIDLEQLIALTAWVATDHPRVHAVGQSWLQRYGAFVARPRLKNLSAAETAELKTVIGDLLDTKPVPRTSARGKLVRAEVELPPLISRPDLCQLRARAAIGNGARAEILLLLAQQADHRRSTAWLAQYSAYSKRSVADALTMTSRAGLTTALRVTNSDAWSLTDATAIRKLLGPLPRTEPRPPVVFRILRALSRNAELLELHSGDAAITEAVVVIESIRTDIVALDLTPLTLTTNTDHRADYEAWARNTLMKLTPGK